MLELLAQTSQMSAQEAGAPQSANGLVIFALFLMILVVPQIVSYLVCKWLKSPDLTERLAAVLTALLAAITPMCYQLVTYPDKSFGDLFRLGVDLAGGTNLVYEIKQGEREKIEAAGEKSFDQVMNNLVGAVSRRANPSGAEDVTVRRVGQDRVEVIVPGADQAYIQEMKERISKAGTLEFEILATKDHPEHKRLIQRARELPGNQDTVYDGNVPVARWVQPEPETNITIGDGEVLPAEFREATRDGKKIPQWLLVLAAPQDRVTGDLLVRATPQTESTTGSPSVGFQFDTTGAMRFLKVTTKYQPLKDGSKFRLAVVLNGQIQSAPTLQSAIGSQGQISGRFTAKEVQKLVDILNAGALDVPLNDVPVSEFTISPLLGQDVRTKGINACLGSAAVVFLFMGVYYRMSGMIANLSLVLNMFLTIAIMVFVQASFTLPGLAGMALTIGMAVDANILIYERMREEVQRGASIKMAIFNGFDKAFSAIFDSNVTTLISAVILYMVGTDQVKGFAVTLFIGIATSMFSALYFGRLVFELMERKRLLTKLNMMEAIKTPSVNFLGKTRLAAIASTVLILVSLGIAIKRGAENFDIDFRGGTMITLQFNEPKKSEEFKEKLNEKFGSSLSLEQLTVAGETGDASTRWRVRVTNEDPKQVSNDLATALEPFGLRKITVKPSEVTGIAEATEEQQKTLSDRQLALMGGSEFKLIFSEPVTTTTARQAIVEGVGELPNGKEKYKGAGDMMEVTGVSKAEGGPKSGEVQRFLEVNVKVRKDIPKEDLVTALAAVEKKMASTPLFEELTNFSSAVGVQTQQQALLAIGLSLISILIYVWFRFDSWSYGIGAVVALFHDVAVAALALPVAAMLSGTPIGTIFGLEDFKVNLPVIAALLTIVGFSINDTIVIFDRVREIKGKSPKLTRDMVNLALNQTLSRTILTSLTTGMTTLVLYLLGGESIHGFTFCMLIGFISGVYSTIYIASPVMLWVIDVEQRRQDAKLVKKPAVAKK